MNIYVKKKRKDTVLKINSYKVVKLFFNSFKVIFKLTFCLNILWIVCRILLISLELYDKTLTPLFLSIFSFIVDNLITPFF